MQESEYSPEIQQRIDNEVRRLQEKINTDTNPIHKRVHQIQINAVTHNPYRYFGLNKPQIEDVYNDLFTPLG